LVFLSDGSRFHGSHSDIAQRSAQNRNWLEISVYIGLRVSEEFYCCKKLLQVSFSMASASRASLAFAFYAYTPLFRNAPARTQPLLNEASIATITLPQNAGNAQLQSWSTANYSSYAPKRKREDSCFGEMIKKRRNGLHMDNEWEMIDA
jgi:hypothetical protein